MNTPAPAPVPLTEDDEEWLMTIYKMRRSRLIGGGFIKCFLSTTIIYFASLLIIEFIRDFFTPKGRLWFGSGYLVPCWQINLLLISVFTVFICIAVYYTWILPFKTDALSGAKFIIPFTVTRKEYFPVTGQYFAWVKESSSRHYEIDADSFANCEEGGVLFMYQAVHSKYIFCENDHIRVDPFSSSTGYNNWGY